MKLIEFEICNVRGIRHLLLKPEGKNLVIWGPNGSGKSAVVDALDFLLTGQIARLTGKGTSDLNLSDHGPHIDCQPGEATVRAVFQLPKSLVEIRRCVAYPNKLECDDRTLKAQLEKITSLAQRGLHVLTRRELIKYITADAKTRSQEVESLLNIDEIGKIRESLVKANNHFGKELKIAEASVKSARGAINATTQEKEFQITRVLEIVNQNRMILGGAAISTFNSTSLKSGIASYALASSNQPVDINLLEKYVSNLYNLVLEQSQSRIAETDEKLRALAVKVQSDPKSQNILSHYKLTELGLSLIGEANSCPLCDTAWLPESLKTHLEQKILIAQVASKDFEEIKSLSDEMAGYATQTIASIDKVMAALRTAGLQESLSFFELWMNKLSCFIDILSSADKSYPDNRFLTHQVKKMLAPDNIIEALKHVLFSVQNRYPKATPEQTAWDTLTRLEENIKALESAEKILESAKISQQRATTLLDNFEQARDKVLGKLYSSVKDRFVELYQQLHEHDGEENFLAKIEPKGAGLNFEVDFYGRGTHPPHAMHSEGHQDSMGICLYLALVERLTQGIIDLVILDDVVMSVDADHRREFCHLLAKSFPDRQFLIATHDKTWANQLKAEGVVSSKGIIEFYRWHVETGPQVNHEVDLWQRIEEDLARNDMPAAAAKLRRGSEEFFMMACDALRAKVPFKLDGRWELGDLLSALKSQYADLLKQSKSAANSWNDQENVELLKELDSVKSSIYKRLNDEQWAINVNVHYNNWANFSVIDFRPVVEAFQDLHCLFKCNRCDSLLRLNTIGMETVGVRCNCGKINWNLTKKKG